MFIILPVKLIVELMGQMSCADSCIIDAFDILLEEYESDGQPDEAQEWESFDPDC